MDRLEQYEAAKKALQNKGLPPEQYEQELKKLAKKFKI